MIQTFLFDMGNVLVSFCHDRMCRQMGELCGHSGPEIRKQLIDTGLQWELERGEVTPVRIDDVKVLDHEHRLPHHVHQDLFVGRRPTH